MLTSTKLRKPRYYKVYFLRLRIGVYLHAKFKVSSIIPTSFRQEGGGIGWGGGDFTPPISKRTTEEPTQIRVKT